MRPQFKILIITGALITAGLSAAAPAAAATAPPTLVTSNFSCSNGVCEVGPGNVRVPFNAGLTGTGGPAYYGPECNPYTMSVVSGSLPPGLQFGEPICEWTISGTPAKAGTYSFTVQITPQPDNLGQPAGPSGTQQLTITIGTGSSDRLVLHRAVWSVHKVGQPLQIQGYDVNTGATSYTVYADASGKKIGAFTLPSNPWNDGSFIQNYNVPQNAGILTLPNPGTITVKDSLRGSATIPVTVNYNY
jgi:hypothetical protein